MRDPRMNKLADVLVGYSCDIKPGDRVFIDSYDVPDDMICALVERVVAAEGLPFVQEVRMKVRRALFRNLTEEQAKLMGDTELDLMKQMDCYIGLRSIDNAYELTDIPGDKMHLARAFWQKPVLDQRVNHTRWCIARWPCQSMAQLAGMSTEQFEDYYFNVCTLDYARMAAAGEILKGRMESADMVRIFGPNDTNISFSIKDMKAVVCAGKMNLPDGEVFIAPWKNSANGIIHFNAGTTFDGKPIDDVRFVVRDGRIIEATGSDTRTINRILDTDDGARYFGEFSFGFNPYITRVMRESLFDEKIAGSIHFTPGSAFEDSDNGNRSRIHWDLTLIQTPEYGGGEVWLDGELVRKDGHFIPEDLQCLNPERLV